MAAVIRQIAETLKYFPFGEYTDAAAMWHPGAYVPPGWLRSQLYAGDVDVLGLFLASINWLAKADTPWWYDWKDAILQMIAEVSREYRIPGAGYNPDEWILYLNTSRGQVSFHVVGWDTHEMLVDADLPESGDLVEWSGVPLQDIAYDLLAGLYEEDMAHTAYGEARWRENATPEANSTCERQ